jgi:predicted nucleic acid-binding Zn finger protein
MATITKYVAEISGRTCYIVHRAHGGMEYVCFGDYYCSCPAFLAQSSNYYYYACKHLLAVQIAEAISSSIPPSLNRDKIMRVVVIEDDKFGDYLVGQITTTTTTSTSNDSS